MKHFFARIVLDPHDPQAKLDLFLQLASLLRLSSVPLKTRVRAYRRIPKGLWGRALRREMEGLIKDLKTRSL